MQILLLVPHIPAYRLAFYILFKYRRRLLNIFAAFEAKILNIEEATANSST